MKIAIFGSSGMARSVLDICDTMCCTEVVFIDRYDGTESITGIPITAEENIQKVANDGFHFVIGIGDNCIRRKIAAKFAYLRFANVVHSSASFGRGTKEKLEATSGNIIMAGSVFSGDITFGNFGLFNFNCVVGHNVRFGDHVHLGPGSIVCGFVDVRDSAYIWTGAMIRNGGSADARLLIGENAVLGMGAIALGDVPAGSSVPPNRVFVGSSSSGPLIAAGNKNNTAVSS